MSWQLVLHFMLALLLISVLVTCFKIIVRMVAIGTAAAFVVAIYHIAQSWSG